MQAELFFDAKATLGEGPAWDEKTQTLYWVDILEKRIYAGTDLLVELDELIGCLAPRKNGNLILALRGYEGRASSWTLTWARPSRPFLRL
ncbi:MAG: SMP-30/gluconolactonase/LRE family protein [Anaerolineales bacterium]|nr:SMP-30/gluconolactonase/LRE family protein [Anaerolineales bacterium]